jgi:hypothetical protein
LTVFYVEGKCCPASCTIAGFFVFTTYGFVREANMSNYTATVSDLCEALVVKPSWVYARTRLIGKVEDPIPCLVVGKYRRFNIPEVIDWLKRKQNSAGNDAGLVQG